MRFVPAVSMILTCFLSLEISAQNAPVSRVDTVNATGSTSTVSIMAAGFNDISGCNLVLLFDSAVARATAVTTGPLMAGDLTADLSVPGRISLGWYVYPGLTLPGEPVLFNIAFEEVSVGTTGITWFDDGYSCIYYDGDYNPLNDIPTGTYYINGSLTFTAPVGLDQASGSDDRLKIGVSPNPFRESANLTYFIPGKGEVWIEIRDMMGKLVWSVAGREEPDGAHTLHIPPSGIGPGVYVAKIFLRTGNGLMTKSSKFICL